MQDLSQGGYGGGASQTALVSSVSCPTGGGGLLAELSRRQGQSQMETDGWEGDATAVVRPPAWQLLCSPHAACAVTLDSADGSLAIARMWFCQAVCSLKAASHVPECVACFEENCIRGEAEVCCHVEQETQVHSSPCLILRCITAVKC